MNTIETKINKDLILREKLAVQRTVMANQTTLLSFIRTSLYFLVAGLSLKSLLKLENSLLFQITFYVVSFSTMVIGLYNYFKQKRLIQNSEIHIGDYKTDYLKQ
jgi:putative membrane protein